jgi:O-antigen/teichoic acid export membrane protein
VIRKTIIRNSFFGLFSQGTSGLIGILLTPFIIRALGMDTYGLWVLAGSFIGYFGLTDFGVRPSVSRFVSLYAGKNEPDNINRVVSTALGVLCLCSLVIMLAAAGSAIFFPQFFHISSGQRETSILLLLIIGATLAVGMPLAVFDAIIIGHDRFDLNYKVETIAALARAGAAIVILLMGQGVLALALSNLAIQILAGFAQIYFARRLFPKLHVALTHCNIATTKELFGLGIWVFAANLWHRFAFATDTLVVGWALDTKAVAIYSIAGRLITLALTGATSFSNVLMPISAALHAKKDCEKHHKLLFGGTTAALLYSIFVAAVFAIYGEPLINVWVGEKFQESVLIMHLLTVPLLVYITARIITDLLLGMGTHVYKWVVLILLVDGLANLFLSIVLARFWGMTGVAAGTLFTMTLTMIVFLPMYATRVFKITYGTYFRNTYGKVLWVAPVLIAWFWAFRTIWPPVGFLATVLPVGITAGLYFLAVYWWFLRFKKTQTAKTLSTL